MGIIYFSLFNVTLSYEYILKMDFYMFLVEIVRLNSDISYFGPPRS